MRGWCTLTAPYRQRTRMTSDTPTREPCWTRAAAAAVLGIVLGAHHGTAHAQVAPSASDIAAYAGLLAAAASGDARRVEAVLAAGADPNVRDGRGRTPLHVAAHVHAPQLLPILARSGADPNALDHDRYDIVTIAAVANDMATLGAALAVGCSARNVTSPYDGTALIAAAHLGHAEVVRRLIAAGAPLDHVNNLGWTALIESIVLGDGGPRHLATLRALVDAGADVNLPDRTGRTPLALARERSYAQMAAVLRHAGAH